MALKCLVCEKPARENSIYCGDDCIRKHASVTKTISSEVTIIEKAAAATDAPAVKTPDTVFIRKISPPTPPAPKILNSTMLVQKKQAHTVVQDKQTGKMLMINLSEDDEKFTKWMGKHPNYVVSPQKAAHNAAFRAKQKQLKSLARGLEAERESASAQRGPVRMQTTLSFDTDKKIVFVNAQGKIVNPVIRKPSDATPPTTKSHQQMTPISKNPKLSSTPPQKPPAATYQKRPVDEPVKAKTSSSGDDIRTNVRKTLIEQLMARTQEITDDNAAKLNEGEIKDFVKSTELEMFKLFGDTNNKYRAKYRSLVFNIKDRKNKTLFEKISTKAIRPPQLVRMSPEDLASQELAKWRENENKHQIEMITKTELDNLTLAKSYLLKTHKGEQEIEAPAVDVQEVMSALKSPPSSEAETIKSSASATSKSGHGDRRSGSDRKSSSSSSKKRKDRSRSRERHSSSSKHKRHRSHDRHRSRDRDREGRHDKSRDHDRDKERGRHRSRSRKSHSSSDGKRDKHDRDHKSSERSKRHSAEKDSEKSESAVVAIKKEESHSLADKIREAETTINRILHPEDYRDEGKEKPEIAEVAATSERPAALVTEPIWHGTVSMVDVHTFKTSLSVLDGDATEFVFPKDLYVVGRIEPDSVWSYLMKIKVSKEIIFLKFHPGSNEDADGYKTFSRNLVLRNRFGVFDPKCEYIKDFYVLPYKSKLPSFIVPPGGLNLSGDCHDALLGIIVKTRPTVTRHAVLPMPKPSRPLLPPPPASVSFPKAAVSRPTLTILSFEHLN